MKYNNTGKIIRKNHTATSGGYTPISNIILQSKTLTPNQKSILVHLISLKTDWSIRKTHLHKDMNIGRDAFRKAFDDLIGLGYIVRITKLKGNLKTYHYTVYEEPVSDLLVSGNTENQLYRKPDSIESNISESNDSENKYVESNYSRAYTSTSILGQTGELTPEQKCMILEQRFNIEEELTKSTRLGKKIIEYIRLKDFSSIDAKLLKEELELVKPLIEKYLNLLSQKV